MALSLIELSALMSGKGFGDIAQAQQAKLQSVVKDMGAENIDNFSQLSRYMRTVDIYGTDEERKKVHVGLQELSKLIS